MTELRFPRSDLQNTLRRVSVLVPSTGEATLSFEAGGKAVGITLAESQFEYRAIFAWDGEFPSFGVNAKTLLSIVGAIRDEFVVFQLEEEDQQLRILTTTSEFSIPLLAPKLMEEDEYEAWDADGEENGEPIHSIVPVTDVASALKRLKYAIGSESGRPYLMVLDVHHGRFRACDGWKYHEINLRLNHLTFSVLESGLDALLKVLRQPHWEASRTVFYRMANSFIFSGGGDTLRLPRLNVNFPDLDTVMIRPLKTKIPSLLRVDAETLISGLKQVRLLTDKDRPAVEMYLTAEQMTLRTSRTNANAVATLPVRWAAQSRTAYFDVNSLLAFLDAYGRRGDIELRFGTDTKDARGPIVAEGEDSWAMLNQLKITDLRS